MALAVRMMLSGLLMIVGAYYMAGWSGALTVWGLAGMLSLIGEEIRKR